MEISYKIYKNSRLTKQIFFICYNKFLYNLWNFQPIKVFI